METWWLNTETGELVNAPCIDDAATWLLESYNLPESKRMSIVADLGRWFPTSVQSSTQE